MGGRDDGTEGQIIFRSRRSGMHRRATGPIGGGAHVVRRFLLTYVFDDVPGDALPILSAGMVDAGMLLVPSGERDVWIEEGDIPGFRMPVDRSDRPCDEVSIALVWERVRMAVLLGLLDLARGNHSPSFVQRAMFEGRVTQVRSSAGSTYWVPKVSEGDGPSLWVLSLLAADIWNDPETYASHLEACEACGAVRLDSPTCSDRCEEHLEGFLEPASGVVLSLPDESSQRAELPSQV